MTDLVNEEILKELAALAQLPFEPELAPSTLTAINEVLTLVGQLQTADTTDISPLAHPLERHQVLRTDTVSETVDRAHLSQNAPSFEDGLYFVPRVIE